MKRGLYSSLFFLTLLFPLLGFAQTDDALKEISQKLEKVPITTKNCISMSPSGNCRESTTHKAKDLRETLSQAGYSTFLWTESSGASYPPHQHKHDERICIMQGEIEFEIKGKTYRLKAGDQLDLPRGTVHSAHVPKTCTYLIRQKG